MHRKISLANPRTGYIFICGISLLFGLLLVWSLLSNASSDVNPSSSYLQAVFIVVVVFLLVTRLLILYILPKRDWKQWAMHHNGQYSFPFNLKIASYGMVLDMLEGRDDITGQQFVLTRTVQTYFGDGVGSQWQILSRRWVILAEPSPSFSNNDIDANNLQITAAKQYLYRVPSYEEMVQLASESNAGPSRFNKI